jgi:hypothetical protein
MISRKCWTGINVAQYEFSKEKAVRRIYELFFYVRNLITYTFETIDSVAADKLHGLSLAKRPC